MSNREYYGGGEHQNYPPPPDQTSGYIPQQQHQHQQHQQQQFSPQDGHPPSSHYNQAPRYNNTYDTPSNDHKYVQPPPQHEQYGQYNDSHATYPHTGPGGGYGGPGSVSGVTPEGERGIGATVIGGATGGLLGHKAGGSKLATVIGSVVGAVGANIIEHQLEQHSGANNSKHGKEKKHKHKKEKKHKKHGSKSRDIHEERNSSSSGSESD